MKREQRRRDREDKEKEGDNDNERRKKWEKDKEREKNRMTEDAMGKDRNRGKEDDTNKDGDQGSKRKRRWDEVGDNGGSSTFAVMATHPTAPLASIALRPGVPEPSPPSLGVDPSEKVSECILLENVFDGSIRREDAFYLVVRDKIHRSSARCGPIQPIYVDRKGFVYLRFYDKTTAADAKKKWHESVYEGSVITAKFMDAVKYRSRFPL